MVVKVDSHTHLIAPRIMLLIPPNFLSLYPFYAIYIDAIYIATIYYLYKYICKYNNVYSLVYWE